MSDVHVACIVGDVEIVKSALDSNGQSILGTTDRYGTAAIHYAACEPNVLSMIIGRVGNINTGEFNVLNVGDKRGNTVLHHCIMSGCIDSVALVIGVPECNVNQVNVEGDAPLHVACKLNNTSAVQLFVANERCDLSIHDRKGDTALHIAAYIDSNGIELVKCLLRSDLNQINSKHETPLHVACKCGHARVVEMLVADERCDPFIQDINGDTALYAAVCMEEYKDKLVQSLLHGCSYDLNGKGTRCTNELNFILDFVFCGVKNMLKMQDYHIMIVKGGKHVTLTLRKGASMNTFKMLLHHIANCSSLCSNSFLLKIPNPLQYIYEHTYNTVSLNIQIKAFPTGVKSKKNKTLLVEYKGVDGSLSYNSDQETLLHAACRSGYSVIIFDLLKYGEDVKAVSTDGNTSFHIACQNLQFSCLGVLKEYLNCHCNQLNADGDAGLHILCGMEISKEKLPEFVKFLRETKQLDINKFNKKGEVPLHIACRRGNGDVVGALVAVKCDVNVCDRLGNTALYIAVCSKIDRLQKVKCLIESDKCNPNVRNRDGLVPLHAACREGNIEVLEMLVTDKRCDVNIQDNNKNTPLHTAIYYAQNEMQLRNLQLLLDCKTCDPNQQSANGDTALHIVSKMTLSLEGKLQYFQLLLSTPGINPEVLNKERLAPFGVTDKDGNTLLHNACEEGESEMVQLLIENGADVLRPDRHGNAPIHIACLNFRLDILRILLSWQHCNPNQQNKNGDTALHIVSRLTLDLNTIKQYLQLFLSTPGINPEVLNNEHLVPFDVSDEDGNTLLHNACAKGKSEMVQLLIENGGDVLRPDRHGNAPIHIACINFRLGILRILLSYKCCNPNQQNEDGDTTLHIVCRMRIGNELEYLKLLLSVPGINPDIANHAGLTVIEVAGTNYTIIDELKTFFLHKRSFIQAYLKLFVVGNSGAGKSTLIKAVITEASQLLKYFPFPKMKYVNPRDVPPHTAGIVPTPFKSKHFGNAVLYDFAGQHEYYSSHAAVMENLILPSPPLFLLLVNISKPMEEIKEELLYWWHFIDNQAQKATAPPHVLLGGSHKDIVKQRGRHQLHTIRLEIEHYINGIPVSFMFAGYFPLDCRRLSSQGLTKLLTQLQTTCKVLREAVDINLHCHILKAFLTTPAFQDKAYCQIIDIVDRIETSDSYLPQHSLEIIPLLKALNDQGHILLLKNHTDEDQSWVILKPEVLLTDVNGSIFAPENFQKRSIDFAMSTGVVTLSTLKENFIKYNHKVIIAYLIHLEFCFRIKDQHTLDIITNNQVLRAQSTDDQEQYYFFPALVSVENPQHMYQQNENITFECGWYYKCGQKTEQLTTRFLHVLILRLAFACEPTDNPAEAESVVLLRRCSVWKHGIAWLNNHDIETIVEVGLQCRWVAVMMRCPDNEKVQCAELRSKVIKTVVKTRKDFCPAIAMKEFLIHPSNLQYPFEGKELTLYSMREIAKVIVEGKPKAVDTMGKNLISIPELLPFEPYFGIHHLIEKFFVGDTSLPVTADDMIRLEIKYRDMLTELKKAFEQDIRAFQRDCAGAECTEVESCNTLFCILQRRGFKTWSHFEEGFSRFSIFCGKNPMVRMVWKV